MNQKETRKAAAAAKAAAELAAAQAAVVAPVTVPTTSGLLATLEDMTPEQAAAILAERKARLSAAAAKAHATRKANGTSSTSAKAAWETRRKYNAALAELAAKAS